MAPRIILLVKFLILLIASSAYCDNCKIPWVENGRQMDIPKFTMELSVVNTTGDYRTYLPQTNYDITIRSIFMNTTFTQFYFFMKNQNKFMSYGKLFIRDSILSKFHNGQKCVDRIVDGPYSFPKLSIKIGWQSPEINSGCIEFLAFVKETDLKYHSLNLTICQDPKVLYDVQGPSYSTCCACDDARYEFAFEGIWSRYTHPKQFPRREWLAVFPTIIGASHAYDFSFWKPYTMASESMRDLAETGNVQKIEMELKSNKEDITTILKLRATNFQNTTKKSYGFIGVNKDHHLISLVARIDPSPDWFVGVSALELCLPDCSWEDEKILNLYAYDAGTKDGISYEDNGGPTFPQCTIQNLNMTWPPPDNDMESPFYDKSNNSHEIRPLARIYFSRVSKSKKDCREPTFNEHCRVTNWSDWSECSASCGIGVKKKYRTYVNKTAAFKSNCEIDLVKTTTCRGDDVYCTSQILPVERSLCNVTEWGSWTGCTASCGPEIKTRTRNYSNQQFVQSCEMYYPDIELEEKRDCGNAPCPSEEVFCADERYTEWSSWSDCNGNGFKYRTRQIIAGRINTIDGEKDLGYSECLYETEPCEESSNIGLLNDLCDDEAEEVNCYNDQEQISLRYRYDKSSNKCVVFRYYGCQGSKNNFVDEKQCREICVVKDQKIDCQVSPWSEWTKCENCEKTRMRERSVVVPPKNGGKPCPKLKTERECQNYDYESCSHSNIVY